MARPQKDAIDYFPHMVHGDKGQYIVEHRHGNDGYVCYFRIKELLAETPGMCFCCGNPSDWEFLLAKTQLSPQKCEDILQTMANVGTIDRDLWEQNRVIWWQKLVDDVKDVFRKRKQVIPMRPHIIVSDAETGISDAEIKVNGDLGQPKPQNPGISAAETPQIRLNYIPPISPLSGNEGGKPEKPKGRSRGKQVKIDVNYEAEIQKALALFPTHMEPKIKAWIQVVASENDSGTISQSRYLNLLGELGDALQATNQADFESALGYATEKKKATVAYILAAAKNKGLDRKKMTKAPDPPSGSQQAQITKTRWISNPNGTWTGTAPGAEEETITNEEFERRKEASALSSLSSMVSGVAANLQSPAQPQGGTHD